MKRRTQAEIGRRRMDAAQRKAQRELDAVRRRVEQEAKRAVAKATKPARLAIVTSCTVEVHLRRLTETGYYGRTIEATAEILLREALWKMRQEDRAAYEEKLRKRP